MTATSVDQAILVIEPMSPSSVQGTSSPQFSNWFSKATADSDDEVGMRPSKKSRRLLEVGNCNTSLAQRFVAANLENVQKDELVVSRCQYVISWKIDDPVPDHIKQRLTKVLRAARTNGNGACALHSVFGRPSPARELFTPMARDIAVAALKQLPVVASEHVRAQIALQSIHSMLWTDFIVAHWKQQPTMESTAFWSALDRMSPDLMKEAVHFCEQSTLRATHLKTLQNNVITASRTFLAFLMKPLWFDQSLRYRSSSHMVWKLLRKPMARFL